MENLTFCHCERIFKVLFDIEFCYLVVFNVIFIILVIVAVQYCGNYFFNSIFFKWFEIWPGLFESRLVLTQD